MLIGSNSKYLLKQTRSKAKMYEYSVPEKLHIAVDENANKLLLVTIAEIGNISAQVLNENDPYRIIQADKKENIEFASHYFDAFLQSKLAPRYTQYYLVLGATAYYLCDYAGSSKVMANMIDVNALGLECGGIETILVLLLQNKLNSENVDKVVQNSPYSYYLQRVVSANNTYFHQHKIIGLEFIKEFRSLIYSQGTPRELLMTDAMLAILLIKIERSALKLLPIYSGLSVDMWEGMLQNKKSIYELWPAQIRLGEAGVFSGKSAIIQMPTSSGKTTSMSIAIRASFLSGRTSMAIVVAPFRSLCREISEDIADDFSDNSHVHVNALSDVLELDDLLELFETGGEGSKNILVLTPEKLLYLLRQNNELIADTGLIIFDEAHMFDDASRGAQYELLISSIMMYLSPGAQKLLLSAVIPNASQINDWFTDGAGVVIADNSIRATEKTVAITDWEISRNEHYGYLYFLNQENPDEVEFFVPRIIEIKPLYKLKKKERNRFFPEVNFKRGKVEHNDIAIYLALKLNHNGGVAIFCGRKDTADGVLKRILKIEDRGIDISSFSTYVVENEHKKIARLIKENYGENNIYYNAALKGVFTHHRGISNGIRISTEYAMKENLIRCIVCTSTLAQGVNLPIRYLIISSIYQAQDRIKVRDFHNLIGRAGRAGKYTEGTILFSETFVYSKRKQYEDKWRWQGYLDMLDSNNSESCLSQFLLLVRPETFKTSHNTSIKLDFYKLALERYENAEQYKKTITKLITQFEEEYPSKISVFKSAIYRNNLSLDAIESYLLSFLNQDNQNDVSLLVSKTFGYFLSDEKEKERLLTLFTTVEKYLVEKINSANRRVAFSRTLLGVNQLLELEQWVDANFSALTSCDATSEILELLMPKLIEYSENKCINAIIIKEELYGIASMWIKGLSYKQIFDYALEHKVKIIRRNKEKDIQLGEIIDICDEGFGYASTLIINAISDLLQLDHQDSEDTCKIMSELCKQMRYGLPTKSSIIIYESGFSDRVVSLRIADELEEFHIKTKREFQEAAKKRKETLMGVLYEFPRVFYDKISAL
jgi:replicative superfamily II helicase